MSDKWEQKTDKGIWSEYVNKQTGESSIKEITPKELFQVCEHKDHRFTVDYASREARCTKCPFVTRFIVGLHKLENGKLVTINPKGLS